MQTKSHEKAEHSIAKSNLDAQSNRTVSRNHEVTFGVALLLSAPIGLGSLLGWWLGQSTQSIYISGTLLGILCPSLFIGGTDKSLKSALFFLGLFSISSGVGAGIAYLWVSPAATYSGSLYGLIGLNVLLTGTIAHSPEEIHEEHEKAQIAPVLYANIELQHWAQEGPIYLIVDSSEPSDSIFFSTLAHYLSENTESIHIFNCETGQSSLHTTTPIVPAGKDTSTHSMYLPFFKMTWLEHTVHFVHIRPTTASDIVEQCYKVASLALMIFHLPKQNEGQHTSLGQQKINTVQLFEQNMTPTSNVACTHAPTLHRGLQIIAHSPSQLHPQTLQSVLEHSSRQGYTSYISSAYTRETCVAPARLFFSRWYDSMIVNDSTMTKDSTSQSTHIWNVQLEQALY